MMDTNGTIPACTKARCESLKGSLETLLTQEFQLNNNLNNYASSTVIGLHTRKEHGLYVRTVRPPDGRAVLLNNILARCWVEKHCTEIGNFEFGNTIHPNGFTHLVNAWRHTEPQVQSWCMVHVTPRFELLSVYSLFDALDLLRMDFRLRVAEGSNPVPVAVDILPFCNLRETHDLRRKPLDNPFQFKAEAGGVTVSDKWNPALHLFLKGSNAGFIAQEDWWFNFRYREEIARGRDGIEEQYVPGYFHAEGRGSVEFTLLAAPSAELLTASQTWRPQVGEAATDPTQPPSSSSDVLASSPNLAQEKPVPESAEAGMLTVKK